MMKITKIIFLTLIGMMLFSSNAEAVKPGSDAIEAFETVESGFKNVTEKINAVTAEVEKVKQAIKDAYDAVMDKIDEIKEKVLGKICDKVASGAEKINDKISDLNEKANAKIQRASQKMSNKLGSLKKKKQDEHFAMMEIATSSDLLSEDDMKNVDKVSEVVNQLFLQYPSSDPVLQKKYREKAHVFWLDTLSEMYVNTRELENQLEDIEKMIEKLEDTQSQAKDLGGDGDGALNEAYITSYQAYTTMNALVRLAETMAVLRAQYRAAKYITTIVEPAPFEGEEEKRSDVVLPQHMERMYAYSITNKFQFAQMNLKAAAAAATAKATAAKSAGGTALKGSLKDAVQSVKTAAQQKAGDAKTAAGKELKFKNTDLSTMYELDENGRPTKLKTAKGVKPEVKTQYAGTEELFGGLKELDEVYDEVTKTLFVHNVEQNLPSFKEQFVEYHHMLDRHKQAVEKVKQSDECAVNYLSAYYKSPEKVWYGGSAPADVTDYMNRKGVSGLVYKTYSLAKNLISEDVDMNDFSKMDMEIEGDVTSDMAGTLENADNKADSMYEDSVDEDGNAKGSVDGFSSASKQEEMTKNDRSREKLAFVVGAKVAKKMAKDQYSNSPQWGVPYRRFPVWEDQKDLYNQYLLGKGMNMRSYIESLLLIDETLSLTKYMLKNIKLLDDEESTEDALANIKSDISKLSNYVSKYRDEIEEKYDILKPVKSIVAKRDAAIKKVQDSYFLKQKTLEAKEKSIVAQLDTIGAKIVELKGKIEDQEQINSEAASAVKQNEDNANDMTKKLKKKGKETSGTKVLLMAEKVKAAATKAQAEAQLKTLNAALSAQNAAQKIKEAELTATRSALATLYEERDEEVLKIEEQYIEPIMRAKKLSSDTAQSYSSSPRLLSSNMSLLERIQSAQAAAITNEGYLTDGIFSKLTGLKAKGLTSNLLRIAEDILVNVGTEDTSIKAYVMKQIDDYYSKDASILEHPATPFVKMLNINNLYTSAGHDAVVTNHKNLMYEISSLNGFKDIFDLGNRKKLGTTVLRIGLSNEQILAKAIELWRKAVIASICVQNQCTTPDNILYVAAIPNGRDFVAPRAASESFLPPMREIVYFDSYDYARTPKKKRFSKMYVTRQALIDNLEDLPDVWVDLLNRRSFVEVGYDMGSLDGESEDYTRGGVFPCRYAGLYVDAKGGKMKLYKSLPNVNTKLLPHCQEVDIIPAKQMQCGLQGGKYLFGDRVYDYGLKCMDADSSADFGLEHQPESELSQLLYYQSNKKKLRFTDEVVKAAKALEKSEKNKEKDGEYSYTPEIAMSQRAQLKRNQFGDFLSIAENEETLRQAKDEMSVSIDDLRQSLINTLKEAGFSPREDLDLAYEDQYKEVKDALEHIKNGNLKKIRAGLMKVNTQGNSALNERFENMNAIYFAMVKDDEELLVLDNSSDGNSAEFAQKLISEKVDRAAAAKYKEEAEEEFQKDMAGGIRPYCAIYGEGDPILPNTNIQLLGQVQF